METKKNDFIKKLVALLEQEELSKDLICYMVSSVDQGLYKCNEFIEDLQHGFEFRGYEHDNTEGYTNGKVGILVKKPVDEREGDDWYHTINHRYHYNLEFLFDERNWGYCQCESNQDGYRKEYKCCGVGCDWDAPSFKLMRVHHICSHKWEGMERDYWNYKDKFFKDDEKYEEEKKRQKQEDLLRQIESLQKQLNDLN